MNKRKLYGLVVCGGQSSRMGCDKSMIEYHGMQQRYFAYRLLSNICEDVFLCCTDEQAKDIEDGYNVLKDDEQFKDQGPLTALLTAFKMYPDFDFVVTGCDYPLLTLDDLLDFKRLIPASVPAAAFYNPAENVYE